VLSGDAAAIAGLLIALVGTMLAQATGKPAVDGAAAIAVGILLMVARIDLADDLPASAVEALANQLDRDLRGAGPTVAEVFLDPTGRKE
jgi:divalent metal cation (Fe/Co/Zn/Cd) transporter